MNKWASSLYVLIRILDSGGLSSRLNSPPSTPLGQGNIYGTSPSFVSSASSNIGCVSKKLDQVLAAFSNQSQLLADIYVLDIVLLPFTRQILGRKSLLTCACVSYVVYVHALCVHVFTLSLSVSI